MSSKKYIAVYARVSSDRQDVASQLPDLRRWVDAYAEGRRVRLFKETASGKSMDRPKWNTVEQAIKEGRVSDLIVWRVDRLGRTAAGLTALFEVLRERKVNFVSVRDGLDLSTAAGRMTAGILASVAEFENSVRIERVKAGQARARAQGKTWGGSQRGRRIKTSITPEQEQQVIRLASEGESKAAIARATGLSRPTIYKVLDREGLYQFQSPAAAEKYSLAAEA